ncbi:MAG: 3'(2'),5'-bisphosphate nucleotidase CysQ [Alphaproteobacteria bacterium MarineAlpha4_Bin2]|nr:MAG: 3'(2'),5'-bisphosphate nucleotidase CysQ [Alphaproteobacteria bacterium MarineAlpha4_Bin2]
MNVDNEMLSRIETLAIEAGETIMKIYDEEFTPKYKTDYSPVTEADTEAERIIISGLAKILPTVPVVAEEAFAAGHSPKISGGRFWLVDPLDGTHEFIDKNGEFTVNIALVENQRPICGVVHAPALDKTYTGIVGMSACIRTGGSAHNKIEVRPPPEAGVIVVASRRHGDPKRIEKLLEGRHVSETRYAGSSLKFCLVAEGEADLYPRFGRTMEWDTAAGQAVLEAAGGRVTKLDGAPFIYAKAGFENPHFIAWGGI